jgi:hypothetical protein
VWIKRDDGTVDRIAPDPGEIDLTVELGGDLCQGLGVGLGAVWACAGTDVVRLDPGTGEVLATLPVGKTHSQGQLVTAFDQLWILTGDGRTLVGVDPRSGEPVTTIPLGVRETDVAIGEAGPWVVSQIDRQVLRIDPASTVALRIDVPRPDDRAKPQPSPVDPRPVDEPKASEAPQPPPSQSPAPARR